MVGPRLFLRALAARTGPTTLGAALCLPLGLGLAAAPAAGAVPASTAPGTPKTAVVSTAAPASARVRTAAPSEPDDSPLRVRIDTMSKTSLPARGTLTIRGTVTNRSDDTWTTIKLYTFLGDDLVPMTDPTALAAAMDVPYDAQVGERLVDVGDEPGLIEVLEPGETASYVVRVPAAALALPAEGPAAGGAYWFGVHALGQGGSLARDAVADGRARTFLPYVPRTTDPVPATLVVPLTQALLFDSDGSVSGEDRWARRLSPGGRLRELLSLGETGSAAGVPISWLVDPALLDAITRLANGNPPRSLAPTPGAAEGPEETDGADGDSETPTDDDLEPTEPPEESDPAEPDAEPLPDTPSSLAARDWLQVAADVLADGEVLALPYGNVDVAATQRLDPGLLDLALAQRSATLTALGIESRPVVAAPQGYVDPALVAATPAETPLLVSDRFLRSPTPGVARLSDHELVVTSSGAEQGSPGPGRSLTAVGLRQRVLAEAAVRALPDPLDGDLPEAAGETPLETPDDAGDESPVNPSVSGQPLVVVLPTEWDLSTAEQFFRGLESDYLTFGSLDSTTSSTLASQLSVADLADAGQQRRELEAETAEAVRELIETGEVMQRVLVENTRVAARVTEQALSGLSYSIRRQQRSARASLALSRGWLDDQLGAVQISTSSGVTLSGDSGSFLVTLSNDLDEPVAVGIAADSDTGITVEQIEPIELGAKSRTTVLLDVSTTTSRVHNVTLSVTDTTGVPLGASDQLPIRSALVSGVIWVIIGVGVGTLFVAIGLRLRRRILAARRGAAGTT